jgi:hypothetical protein
VRRALPDKRRRHWAGAVLLLLEVVERLRDVAVAGAAGVVPQRRTAQIWVSIKTTMRPSLRSVLAEPAVDERW